ncbi:MAG: hypothetical protein ABGX16_20060 [Pirellulales bacterium]
MIGIRIPNDASKMRFLAAPFIALLEDGVWLRNAQHANRCAARLAADLSAISGINSALSIRNPPSAHYQADCG